MREKTKGDWRTARLHFFGGLIASGKSSLAQRIAREQGAVLLIEDDWLRALWPGELRTLEDYQTRSRRLKSVLWPHVSELLAQGAKVVLDFPANTRAQRVAFRELVSQHPASHVLHHLDVPPEICRERLATRNAAGAHPFETTVEIFDLFTRLFEPPADDEGFTIRVWPNEPTPPNGGA